MIAAARAIAQHSLRPTIMRKLLLSTALATAACVAPALANPVISVTDVSIQGDIVTIAGPAWFRSGLHAKRGVPWLARLWPLSV